MSNGYFRAGANLDKDMEVTHDEYLAVIKKMTRMSKLEIINKILLQWFFVRLTRCSDNLIIEYDLYGLKKIHGKKVRIWYSLMGWVIPTSGWNSDYKYLGNRWFRKLTKTKLNDVNG